MLMNFTTGKTSVPNWLILVLFILLILLSVFLYYFILLDKDDVKLIGVSGGVVSGLIVFLLTFVIQIRPLKELDKYRKMGIKGLLKNRHDQEYYRQLVGNSTRRVYVMGASCSRFIDDFLDFESEDKVLVDAMTKHKKLEVRLLIPDVDYIGEDSSIRINRVLPKLETLERQFNGRIQLRRFKDIARHSFVIADDELVAGPIFEVDKSKYDPAVHVATWTAFGRKYREYFNTVWNSCNEGG